MPGVALVFFPVMPSKLKRTSLGGAAGRACAGFTRKRKDGVYAVDVTAIARRLAPLQAPHHALAAAGASVQTAKSRKKEKTFGKSGGLKGFSRTKANKDVTETWSGAVVGTGASIGGGMAAYAAGAVVGQVSRANYFIQLYCFVKSVH